MGKTDFIVDKENLEVRMSRVFDAPRERVWQAPHYDKRDLEEVSVQDIVILLIILLNNE